MKNPTILFVIILALSVVAVAAAYYLFKTAPSEQGIIGLSSAYTLAAILFFTVIQVFQQPKLVFSNDLREIELTVEHKMGSFKIRLLLVGIENEHGLLGDTAEDAETSIRVKEFVGEPPFEEQSIGPLPWQHYRKSVVHLDKYLDPRNPQDVWDSLTDIVFDRLKTPIYQGRGKFVIVGYALETTGNFYFAYEEPQNVEIDLNKLRADSKKRGMTFEPFVCNCFAKNLKGVVQSETYFLLGHTWDTIQLIYPTQVKTRRIEAREKVEQIPKESES